jgi:hypothetical protein
MYTWLHFCPIPELAHLHSSKGDMKFCVKKMALYVVFLGFEWEKLLRATECQVWAEEVRRTPATTLPCTASHRICHHEVFCHQVWRKSF